MLVRVGNCYVRTCKLPSALCACLRSQTSRNSISEMNTVLLCIGLKSLWTQCPPCLCWLDLKNKNKHLVNSSRLETMPAYRRFVIVAVAATIIAVGTIVTQTPAGPIEHLLLYGFAIISVWFAARMTLDTFGKYSSLYNEGIEEVGLFSRKVIHWDDIRNVSFDNTFNAFVITSSDTQIRVSKFCIGIYDFLDQLTVKAPKAATKNMPRLVD